MSLIICIKNLAFADDVNVLDDLAATAQSNLDRINIYGAGVDLKIKTVRKEAILGFSGPRV